MIILFFKYCIVRLRDFETKQRLAVQKRFLKAGVFMQGDSAISNRF